MQLTPRFNIICNLNFLSVDTLSCSYDLLVQTAVIYLSPFPCGSIFHLFVLLIVFQPNTFLYV